MAKQIKSTCFCHTVGYGWLIEAESNNHPEVRADADCPTFVVEK